MSQRPCFLSKQDIRCHHGGYHRCRMPRQKFSERFSKFCQESDTHGVKFAYPEEKSGLVRRVVWSLLLLGSFTFLSYFFYLRVDYFLQYETTTRTTFITRRSDIPFPSVILCPPTAVLNASCLTVGDIISDEIYLLDLQKPNVVERRDNKTFLKLDARTFFQTLSKNASEVILGEDAYRYLTRLGVQQINLTLHRDCQFGCLNWRPMIATLASHDIRVPINDQRVTFKEVEKRCAPRVDVEQSVKSECSFDEVTSVEDMSCPVVQYPIGNEKCLTFNGTTGNKNVASVYMEINFTEFVSSGTDIGVSIKSLRVILDYGGPSQVEHYLSGDGSKLIVEKTLRLRPLSHPYDTCGRHEHMWISVDGKYSKLLCLKYCEEACRSEGNYFADCRRVCARHTSSEFHVHEDGCPDVGCDEIKYQVALKEKEHRTTPNPTQSFSFSVFLSEFADMTVYTEVPMYPVESLLAELGGTMGLFVGISLLTVLHCLEFVCTEIFSCVTRRRGRPPRVDTDVVGNIQELAGDLHTDDVQGTSARMERLECVVNSLVEKVTVLQTIVQQNAVET